MNPLAVETLGFFALFRPQIVDGFKSVSILKLGVIIAVVFCSNRLAPIISPLLQLSAKGFHPPCCTADEFKTIPHWQKAQYRTET